MATYNGTEIKYPRLSSSSIFGLSEAQATKVGDGKEFTYPKIESTDTFGVTDSSAVRVGNGVEIGYDDFKQGVPGTTLNSNFCSIGSGAEIYVSARAALPTDTGHEIVIGFHCDFKAVPTVQKAFLPVSFYDTTFGPKIIAWVWHLGDGHISYEKNPVHRYLKTGYYSIVLEVYSWNGKRSFISKRNYIHIIGESDMLHYYAFRKLTPVEFGGDFDNTLRVEGAVLDKLYGDTDSVFDKLAIERFPDTAVLTLSNWERFLDIIPTSSDAAVRRKSIISKLRSLGGLSKPYFESIAVAFGYKIGTHVGVGDPHLRIDKRPYPAFRADISQADVDAVYDQVAGSSIHTWHVYGTNVETNTELISTFAKLKPAHTEVVYINE